jgi:hypothetical protein
LRSWNIGNWADGGRGSFGRLKSDGLGDGFLERATRARLKRKGDETSEDLQSGGERCGGSLGTDERRQGVRWFGARTGGDDVVDGLLQFNARALDTREIVAESTGDGLFDGVGFR